MEFFNHKINLKQILLITTSLLIGNSFKLFVLYKLRTEGDIDFYNYIDHLYVLLFSLVSVISVLVSWKLINKIYTTNTIVKFIKVYILSFVIFNILGLIVDYILLAAFSSQEYDILRRFINTLSIAFILFDVFALTSAFLYFRQSQKVALELEHTEKEKAILKSQMLQKNLEPHFLFNNLSLLSGLASRHPEQIESFIDDFSDVYRYYLKHGKKQLVELKEELSFLKSYMNLMKRRFGNAYQIESDFKNIEGFIIPCSLQLCIENAIKHNKGSEENPLLISLSRKKNTIVIKNKLNKVDFTFGTGTGNDYLKRQYLITSE